MKSRSFIFALLDYILAQLFGFAKYIIPLTYLKAWAYSLAAISTMLQLRYMCGSDGIHSFKDQLSERIKELNKEIEVGQKELAKLDATRARLREWIPRKNVAIQMLEEEVTKLNEPSQCNDEKPEKKSGTVG